MTQPHDTPPEQPPTSQTGRGDGTGRFGSALSTSPELVTALEEVSRQALAAFTSPPKLAIFFVSHHHAISFESLGRCVQDATRAEILLGCTGEAILGTGREIEGQPALSLWVGDFPGKVREVRLDYEITPNGGQFRGSPEDLPLKWPPDSAMLLLADPFSFPAERLLHRLNEVESGVPVVGGMASGGWDPGQNRLWLGGETFDSGAVGLYLEGVSLRSVVSQGCRPIGRSFVVTRAEKNLLLELGGQPAMTRLQEVFEDLPVEERELVRQGLHLGQVINEYQDSFQRGDFLVRNVVGADPEHGSLAIGDLLRVGRTVQFHVRDARTADEDLRELLAGSLTEQPDPRAALIFSCNGRGRRLFGTPHHDAAVVQELAGPIPTAGLFAQGELGPVGGRNFLHGFTASVVLFGPG